MGTKQYLIVAKRSALQCMSVCIMILGCICFIISGPPRAIHCVVDPQAFPLHFCKQSKPVVGNDGLEPLPAHNDWLFYTCVQQTHHYLQCHCELLGFAEYKLWYNCILAGNNEEWNTFVTRRVMRWRTLFSWVINSTDHHPTLVVRYEDLKQNTIHQVKRSWISFSFLIRKKWWKNDLRKILDNFGVNTEEALNTLLQSKESMWWNMCRVQEQT